MNEETGYDASPNEFFCIKSYDSNSHEILAKFNGDKIIPLKYANDKA